MPKKSTKKADKEFVPPTAKGGKVRGMGSGEAASGDLKPLCKQFHELRLAKDELNKDLTRINGEMSLLSDQLVEKFQQAGLESIKMENLGTFFVSSTPRPKVADEVALFKDLRRRKMGDIIKETVHAQTLGATVRELRDKGEPDLAGIEIFEQVEIRMRKL